MVRLGIVTPCLNVDSYISETISSVLHNRAVSAGTVEVDYVLVDGGSRDSTIDIAGKMFDGAPKNVQASIISEPDNGMYDALAKGLARIDADIIAYINAGDFYSPTAMEIVPEIFQNGDVDWLTGLTVIYSERSDITDVKLPYRYRRKLVRAGFYGRYLPYIQQESTFWSSKLLSAVDLDALAKCRLAGDYFLWSTFAKLSELEVVEAWLGGFRVHRGQLSEQLADYLVELKTFSSGVPVLGYAQAVWDRMIWLLPNKIKKAVNSGIFAFDPESHRYIRTGEIRDGVSNREGREENESG